jgi:hypothetical protein
MTLTRRLSYESPDVRITATPWPYPEGCHKIMIWINPPVRLSLNETHSIRFKISNYPLALEKHSLHKLNTRIRSRSFFPVFLFLQHSHWLHSLTAQTITCSSEFSSNDLLIDTLALTISHQHFRETPKNFTTPLTSGAFRSFLMNHFGWKSRRRINYKNASHWRKKQPPTFNMNVFFDVRDFWVIQVLNLFRDFFRV